ncbi:alpha/beta hydrolase [Bacillus sp. OV166]|uniref:alpha/beta hydrolase n=1 Tax=Bacillus sp. OV166 TaxID=1882763 RepID=UPI000B4371A9|nr:alpha/beta hydrolase [Bacillus sp. OV166]
MIHEKINLSNNGKVKLITYIHDNSVKREKEMGPAPKRPAIIVLPGGAYYFISERETEPVALTFMKEGFNTFVLHYSFGDDSIFPNPLLDVSLAILTVRKNAEKWGIDPDAICLMGFSAGSGIAALSATQWNNPEIAEKLGVHLKILNQMQLF